MRDLKPALVGLIFAHIAIIILALLWSAVAPFWLYILVAMIAGGGGSQAYQELKIREHLYQQTQKDIATPEDHQSLEKDSEMPEEDPIPEKKAFVSINEWVIFLFLALIVALIAIFMYGP